MNDDGILAENDARFVAMPRQVIPRLIVAANRLQEEISNPIIPNFGLTSGQVGCIITSVWSIEITC